MIRRKILGNVRLNFAGPRYTSRNSQSADPTAPNDTAQTELDHYLPSPRRTP